MSAWFEFYFRSRAFSISWTRLSRSMEQAVRYTLTFAIWSKRDSQFISIYLYRMPFLFFPLFLACSMRSEIFRLCERPKTSLTGVPSSSLSLSLFFFFFFLPCSIELLAALYYLNARNRLIFRAGRVNPILSYLTVFLYCADSAAILEERCPSWQEKLILN